MYVSNVRINNQQEARPYILQGLGLRIDGMRAGTIRFLKMKYLS